MLFSGRVRATAAQWNALWAAWLGFLLDATDVLLYVFALQAIRAEFRLTHAEAGLVGSLTLVSSAAGGVLFGILADRIGRKQCLIYTILLYSLASAGTAFSRGWGDLIAWRALVGLGLGGEWSAGALLVAETWPPEHRGKAIGWMQSGWALGYILAAGVSALILPRFGWRVLFLVGVLPALLTLAVRRHVSEPTIWSAQRSAAPLSRLFGPTYRARTLLAGLVTTCVMFAYWGLFTWLPGFLAAPREQGGAALDLLRTSAWVAVLQVGAFLGYVSFGWVSDWIGRRPSFAVYVAAAALLVPVYGFIPLWAGDDSSTALLVIGPLVGFFGSGYFSLFGAMLAELYPTALRGAGQGLTYNAGRAAGALAPFVVGFAADRKGLGLGLALCAAFYALAGILVFLLPETRQAPLDA